MRIDQADLMDFPVHVQEMIEFSSGGILSKEILKSPKADVTLFCMASGTELSEHTSTREALVHVLHGSGEFSMEGRDIPMKPGVIIHMRPDAVHSLKAAENLAFLLYLF
jgi:nitric oxide dioxygenase